jgi:acetyl esterase/lipase
VLPRQTISLADRLKAAGNDVELKIYENVDHIDIMLALSRPFRDSANTLADLTGFARRVTA